MYIVTDHSTDLVLGIEQCLGGLLVDYLIQLNIHQVPVYKYINQGKRRIINCWSMTTVIAVSQTIISIADESCLDFLATRPVIACIIVTT